MTLKNRTTLNVLDPKTLQQRFDINFDEGIERMATARPNLPLTNRGLVSFEGVAMTQKMMRVKSH
jgi:hypothetical protein